MMAIERAKQVLNLCQDELKTVPHWAKENLIHAIAAEIEEALRWQMYELNKRYGLKEESHLEPHPNLLKVQKKKKH